MPAKVAIFDGGQNQILGAFGLRNPVVGVALGVRCGRKSRRDASGTKPVAARGCGGCRLARERRLAACATSRSGLTALELSYLRKEIK